jgi:hypothetical protein
MDSDRRAEGTAGLCFFVVYEEALKNVFDAMNNDQAMFVLPSP